MGVRTRDHRTYFRDVSGSSTLLATDDLSTNARHLVPARVGFTIYINRLTVMVSTDHAATQLFQDTAGTPVIIAKTKASPGLVPIEYEYGEEGVALTPDKGFDMKNSGAGLAANVHWEGYMKLTEGTAITADALKSV